MKRQSSAEFPLFRSIFWIFYDQISDQLIGVCSAQDWRAISIYLDQLCGVEEMEDVPLGDP